jgi:hypothetical protein
MIERTPLKIEPSKEAIEAARRAIEAGQVFECVSGQPESKEMSDIL